MVSCAWTWEECVGVYVFVEHVSYETCIPTSCDPWNIGSKWIPNNLHSSLKHKYHYQWKKKWSVDYPKITEDKSSENRVYILDARLIIATRINAKAQSMESAPQHQYSTKTRELKPASQHHCSPKSQSLKLATRHHCSLKTQSLKPMF